MGSRIFAVLLVFACCIGHAAAAPQMPKEVRINGVEFIHVPPGWFWYALENSDYNTAGDPGYPYFRDIKVWLDGYYIGKYEARARDLKRFMDGKEVVHRDQYGDGETEGCSLRRNADGAYVLVNEEKDFPATHLSWELANEFTRWMGFRLPTEGEWIKAARGTDKRLWPWGDEYPDDTRAGYNSGVDCKVSPVDAFPLGRSPYGAYNMAGNVFEFVQDWYNKDWDLALKDGAKNPQPSDTPSKIMPYRDPMRMLHGGRWASPANGITIYRRNLHKPDRNFICYGTRFALDEKTVAAHLAQGTAEVLVP